MSTVVVKRPPLEWFREEIPAARWSGSGPYTLQINVDYINENTIIDASLDSTITNLTSQLEISSGNGYVLLSTATLPSGQINVTIMPNGESRIVKTEVLADCYSSSQVDSLVNPLQTKIGTTNISGIGDGTLTGAVSEINVELNEAVNEINAGLNEKINIADVVNNLTSTATNKPLSAAQGKALNDNKLNISDVVNNLTSTATNKPLSAAQGKALNDDKLNRTDVVDSLTSTATNAPLSAAQGKALNDAKLNISDVVNNLTSTATDKPLSAAQGKALYDDYYTGRIFSQRITCTQLNDSTTQLVGTFTTPTAPAGYTVRACFARNLFSNNDVGAKCTEGFFLGTDYIRVRGKNFTSTDTVDILLYWEYVKT